MRGTLPQDVHPMTFFRFIPAYAGNALQLFVRVVAKAVHPRVCGERFLADERRGPRDGSSPRMRGTRNRRTDRAPRRPVHPRVCGERFLVANVKSLLFGSSPRMRGTLPWTGNANVLRRFIPAYAGNAGFGFCASVRWPVHPRICGERLRGLPPTLRVVGSSPRMRGTRACILRCRR